MKLIYCWHGIKSVLNPNARRSQNAGIKQFDTLEQEAIYESGDFQDERETAVLIPGITRTGAVLNIFARELSKIYNVVQVQISANDWNHPNGLDYIKEIVLTRINSLGISNFNVIGHSTGGGVALILGMTDTRVRRVTQIATPNGGSVFYLHPSVRDLEGAKQMNRGAYNGIDIANPKLEVVSIITTRDECVHTESQSLKGIGINVNSRDVEIPAGHYSIVTEAGHIRSIMATM